MMKDKDSNSIDSKSDIKSENFEDGELMNSPARRGFLKSIGAAGVASGLTGFTGSASATEEGGILQTTNSFVRASVDIPEPEDAILVSSDAPFPKTIESDSSIYLPLGPVGKSQYIFDSEDPKPLIEGPNGFHHGHSNSLFSRGPIWANQNIAFAGGSMNKDISLTSSGKATTLKFGPERIETPIGKKSTHTQQVEVTYETGEGTNSKVLPATIEVENFGEVPIVTHSDFVVIPKKSPGGRYIGSTLLPELNEKGEIGTWTDIVEFENADAWGIEVNMEGDK